MPSVSSCSFLNLWDFCQAASLQDQQKEKETFLTLTARTQEKVLVLMESLRGASANTRAQALEAFLDRRVHEKIEKERGAAKAHYLAQKTATEGKACCFESVNDSERGENKTNRTHQGLAALFPGGSFPSVGAASFKGLRPKMEDALLMGEVNIRLGEGAPFSMGYIGVVDGHGPSLKSSSHKKVSEASEGKKAADFFREQFPRCLKAAIERYNPRALSDRGLFAACKRAFLDVQAAYQGGGGATVCVVLRVGDDLWVCNLGDARAVWVTREEGIQLTEDHTCDVPRLVQGILNKGGRIEVGMGGLKRINGMLVPSRSFGDRMLVGSGGKSCTICTPKIAKYGVGEPGVLLIACDGLWEVCTTQAALDWIWRNWILEEDVYHLLGLPAWAQAMAEQALRAGTMDNISVVMAFLQPVVRATPEEIL